MSRETFTTRPTPIVRQCVSHLGDPILNSSYTPSTGFFFFFLAELIKNAGGQP